MYLMEILIDEVIDLYIPEKSSGVAAYQKTNLVLHFHGGGFVSGDKGVTYNTDNDTFEYLENNIAFGFC